MRHPSYTGAFPLYAAMPTPLHSWWTCLAAAVLLPLAFARRIGHEEASLRWEIPEYEAYAQEVKAVIPYIL